MDNMRIILDENLPANIKREIKDFHREGKFVDIGRDHTSLLDMEIYELMEDDDILVTGDLELHRNYKKLNKNSVYFSIQKNNLIEVQIKLAYHLKGVDQSTIETKTTENKHIFSGPNAQLRKRFDELKKENARLRTKVNILEGKLKSILNTANSALDD